MQIDWICNTCASIYNTRNDDVAQGYINEIRATLERLAAMDSEPVAWEYEFASHITCGGPQDFERIIELEAPPEWAIEKGLARNIIPLYRHAPAPRGTDHVRK
ncbi:hypothetical protein BU9_CDS0001 [Klebsiella phage Kpn BU9]|nr:hypothetical protein BU9_CDS0001 [Klebsiella phage Kpn BU9]